MEFTLLWGKADNEQVDSGEYNLYWIVMAVRRKNKSSKAERTVHSSGDSLDTITKESDI